jgi:hypothetical protein
MDRLSRSASKRANASNGAAATVTRQFSPSRIELQLLTQVFELVCGQRGDMEESCSTRQSELETHRVSDREQTLETHVVGRRAA